MRKPLVSIIIVNTNDEKFLINCLTSLKTHEPQLEVEIIIVDNHSKSDIRPLLENYSGDIKILSLDQNVGFCKANNHGIRHAQGEYILLLNPDTVFFEPSISHCIAYFEKHKEEKIGAIGCRLLNEDGTIQKSFYHSAASIIKTLRTNSLFRKFAGNHRKQKIEKHEQELHLSTGTVPWLCGAVLLMSNLTVKERNFFLDEDFFLYSDDCELGYRMRRNGFLPVYFTGTSITHLGGSSTPSLRKFEQLTASEWLCMMKIHGKLYLAVNQLLLMINWMLDEFFFIKKALFHSTSFSERRNKIIRKRLWKLWKRYTLKILFQFSRRPSSSSQMLRYAG